MKKKEKRENKIALQKAMLLVLEHFLYQYGAVSQLRKAYTAAGSGEFGEDNGTLGWG